MGKELIWKGAIEYYKMKLREDQARESFLKELVTEIDCQNLGIKDGMGFCRIYQFAVNTYPCMADCEYHRRLKPDFVDKNRECYEGE